MTNDEEVTQLNKCSDGELLDIVRIRGLGVLRHGIERSRLIAIARGEAEPVASEYSGTQETRKQLQAFIAANIDQIRNQLPGCDGCCTTFPCSEARHALCYLPNARRV